MPQLPPPPPEMKSACTGDGRDTLETFTGAWQTVLWEGHDGGGRRVTASWGHSESSDSYNASCNTIHTGREGGAWDVRGGQVCGGRWQGACDGEPQSHRRWLRARGKPDSWMYPCVPCHNPGTLPLSRSRSFPGGWAWGGSESTCGSFLPAPGRGATAGPTRAALPPPSQGRMRGLGRASVQNPFWLMDSTLAPVELLESGHARIGGILSCHCVVLGTEIRPLGDSSAKF